MNKFFRKMIIGISVFILIILVFFAFDTIQRKTFVNSALFHINNEIQNKNQTTIPINQEAPVIAKSEILIEASVDKVWSILTDIDNWNKWQSSVTQSKLIGGLQQGNYFYWKADGLNFESIIHTSIQNRACGWVGTTIGAQAIHNWSLETQDENTLVIVEESLQGILPSLLKGIFSDQLRKGMDKNLNELKHTCERE